ncbi:MAG TPA: M14 family zinc carboxypeptidase [Planctomycetaceae bacterium]|nr:M14 family zinc carboxypeptidase [Planctomycetaceae bacterium]
MRLLRFLIAAVCGVLATAFAFEHRGDIGQLLAKADLARFSVGPAAPVDDLLAESAPEPIKVVPIALPTAAMETAPSVAETVTPAPEPRWHIVDAGLNDADLKSIPVRTVSDTATAPVTTVAVTKAKAASSATATKSKWEIIGQSANNMPIHIRKTGAGSDITLIVAGLDGEDRIAVKWVDQLSQRIDEAPELVADRQLILLRAVNPDGLTVKQPGNGHGVTINRNFPTAAYRAGGLPSAGSGPASEPETRAVLQLLSELRPQRIIHVQSANKTTAISNTKSAAVAMSWQQALHTAPQPFNPEHQPGSLEDYTATVLGLEVVSLQLPTGDDWRSAGLTHVPTLLAMSAPISAADIAAATLALKDPATDRSLEGSAFRDDGAPVSSAADPRPQRKGYEELPPPPFKPNW